MCSLGGRRELGRKSLKPCQPPTLPNTPQFSLTAPSAPQCWLRLPKYWRATTKYSGILPNCNIRLSNTPLHNIPDALQTSLSAWVCSLGGRGELGRKSLKPCQSPTLPNTPQFSLTAPIAPQCWLRLPKYRRTIPKCSGILPKCPTSVSNTPFDQNIPRLSPKAAYKCLGVQPGRLWKIGRKSVKPSQAPTRHARIKAWTIMEQTKTAKWI